MSSVLIHLSLFLTNFLSFLFKFRDFFLQFGYLIPSEQLPLPDLGVFSCFDASPLRENLVRKFFVV